MEKVIKRSLTDYCIEKSTYVDLAADLIAEPSSSHSIPLLDALPPSAAAFYSDECNLLQGGAGTVMNASFYRFLVAE